MKKNTQILTIIFSVSLLFSCSKKADPDIRSGFVGNWLQTKVNGSPKTSSTITVIAKKNLVANGLTIDSDDATASSATNFSFNNTKILLQQNASFTNGKTGDIYLTNGTGTLLGSTTLDFSFGTRIEFPDGSTGKLTTDPYTFEFIKQ